MGCDALRCPRDGMAETVAFRGKAPRPGRVGRAPDSSSAVGVSHWPSARVSLRVASWPWRDQAGTALAFLNVSSARRWPPPRWPQFCLAGRRAEGRWRGLSDHTRSAAWGLLGWASTSLAVVYQHCQVLRPYRVENSSVAPHVLSVTTLASSVDHATALNGHRAVTRAHARL